MYIEGFLLSMISVKRMNHTNPWKFSWTPKTAILLKSQAPNFLPFHLPLEVGTIPDEAKSGSARIKTKKVGKKKPGAEVFSAAQPVWVFGWVTQPFPAYRWMGWSGMNVSRCSRSLIMEVWERERKGPSNYCEFGGSDIWFLWGWESGVEQICRDLRDDVWSPLKKAPRSTWGNVQA